MTCIKTTGAIAAGILAGLIASQSYAQEAQKIGVAVPYFKSPFWTAGIYGVEKASGEKGYEIVKADAGDDGETQIAQVKSFIDQKVSAIIIGAADGKALGPIVDEAIKGGIPVVALSTPPAADKLTSFVGADNIGLGRLQAICLGRALNGKGKVAALAGPDEIWATLRAKGFADTMAADFPDIEIVATELGGASKAADLTAGILAKHPDLNGVFTAADSIALAAVKSLQTAGVAGKVVVSTSNLNPDAQKSMQDGNIACASLQPVVTMGREAVAEVTRALEGRNVLGRVVARTLLVTGDKLAAFDFSEVNAPAEYHP